MKKFINSNVLSIAAIVCLLSSFLIPEWISLTLFGVVIVISLFYVLDFHVKDSYKKDINEDIDDIKPSKFCYVDEATDCEYVVSIVYDNYNNSYRILENKSNVIFEFKFDCSDDAKQYIKEHAKDNHVIGIKCYNCVGNLIKK